MAEPDSTLKTFWMLTRQGLVGTVKTTISIGTILGLAYAAYTAIGFFFVFCTRDVASGIFTIRTKHRPS